MKKWLKISLVLLAVAAVSVGIFFILKALGITTIEGLRQTIAATGAWSWVVFIVLFILCTTLLCFIPGTSATFIAVSIIMFGAWKGFIISTISVFLGSSLMFLIGNTLGEKAIIKLVGKESLEKAQNLLDMKSKMLLPLMFLFPAFPDDALCMVAGMTKMKYWYFAIIAAIFRTIGIATICFLGSGLIDWATLSLTDWFVLINVCLFDVVLIFKYQDKLEKFILRKKSKNPEKPNKTQNNPEQTQNQQLENLQKKIEKHQQTIDQKKYCSQEQLHNVEKKLRNAKRQLAKMTKSEPTNQEKQAVICSQIEKIMANQFPNIKYSIKKSESTASVYLSFENSYGVQKAIRISDHQTYRNIKQYSDKVVFSNKAMVAIINKALKSLSTKTVFVMLDKLKEGEE